MTAARPANYTQKCARAGWFSGSLLVRLLHRRSSFSMNRNLRNWMGCVGLLAVMVLDGAWANAQANGPQPASQAPPPAVAAGSPTSSAPGAAKAVPPAGAQAPGAPAPAGPYRKLAPWVMQSVNPMREYKETVCRHDVVELLAVDPNLSFAKNVAFRREIWALQFKFKPIRFVWVDLPQSDGTIETKLVRYMVYSVTNPGKVAHPAEQADGTYKLVPEDKPVRFAPQFLLASLERGDDRVYEDRVIPAAAAAIRRREDPNRVFYNSVEMHREIAVGETVWGVATWEGVDPRIDRFCIYVIGLTNAYRWEDTPGGYKPGDRPGTGRRLLRKTLKLNFWRPGDEFYEREDEIRFGIPGQVDYEWVYR